MAFADFFSKRNIALGTAALSLPPTAYFLFSSSSKGTLDSDLKAEQLSESLPTTQETANSVLSEPKAQENKSQKSSGRGKFSGKIPHARASARAHKSYTEEEITTWKDDSSHGTIFNKWKDLTHVQKYGYQTVFNGGRIFNPFLNDDSYIDSLSHYNPEEFEDNNKNQKTIAEKEANEIIETLRDYTVYLNEDATAWILDYELPSDDKKYPTRWFLVASAHTVVDMCFRDDPYKQNVHLRQYTRSCRGSSAAIYKYKGEGYAKYEEWKDSSVTQSQPWTTETLPENLKYNYITDAKLIYVPKNLFGAMFHEKDLEGLDGKQKKVWADEGYMVDLVVMEVDFGEKAADMTNNFYTKYKNKKDNERIDFFADEPTLENGYDENFFSAGRPDSRGTEEKIVSNYSSSSQQAGRLVKKEKHSAQEKIWNKKKNVEFGIRYELDKKMPAKSVGSLAIDSKRKVLGVMVDKSSSQDKTYYVPLRHSGIRSPDYANWFVTPKYDLILGADGQVGSYREQLETYLKDVNTYLKSQWDQREDLQKKIKDIKKSVTVPSQ